MSASSDRTIDPRHAASAAPPQSAPARERTSDVEQQRDADPRQWAWVSGGPGKLIQALVFGAAFGLLLQKGGVAKFDILIGALLLENFVVEQVMLSAILVGMIGVYVLRRMGVLELQIKETVYGANIVGGLIFGVGFALIAYCPGTNAAAVGQGNLDAIVGMLGMMLGSYLFALSSKYTSGTVTNWGQRGKITLADLAGVSHGKFIAMLAPALLLVLAGLEWLSRR
jgi:hypothetical protein